MDAFFIFYTTRGEYSREDVAGRFPKDLESAVQGIFGLDLSFAGKRARIAFPDFVAHNKRQAELRCKELTSNGELGLARAVRIKKLYSKGIDSRLVLPAKHKALTERIANLTKSRRWDHASASKEALIEYFSQRAFNCATNERSFLKCSSCGSTVSTEHLLKPDCPVCSGVNTLLLSTKQRALEAAAEKVVDLMSQRNQVELAAREKVWLKIGGDQQWEWYVGCWVPSKVPAERDGVVHALDAGATLRPSF